MIGELDRANCIITEFLALARSKPVEQKPGNLNEIIKALLPLIVTDAMNSEKYVRLELTEVPNLLLSEEEIRQIILNLTRNGLEAMYPGNYLTIKTFHDAKEVVLTVQDQG